MGERGNILESERGLNEKPPSDWDLSGSPVWDLNGNPIDWDASQSTSGKLDWDLNGVNADPALV
jgi:hypothetical protein